MFGLLDSKCGKDVEDLQGARKDRKIEDMEMGGRVGGVGGVLVLWDSSVAVLWRWSCETGAINRLVRRHGIACFAWSRSRTDTMDGWLGGWMDFSD